VAIILVIMHHSHPYFAGITHYQLPRLLENILDQGDKGVTLFFVMSAFTLCLSLAKKKQTEVRPVRNYFLRRLFRIVPLYYCAIMAVWLAGINSPGTGAVVANLFFLHGLSPYWINAVIPGGWSVGVEILFYVFFPLLLNYISSASSALYVTMFCIIIAKAATGIMSRYPLISDQLSWGIFTYENIISQLPVFMTGICLYFISTSSDLRSPGIHKAALFIALLVVIHLLGGNLFKVHYLFAIAFSFLAFGLSK
jgi:peptidoglycan/LPS O-acetylase OafA/YrhL